MSEYLLGKSILITGAGNRIGKSLAIYLAEQGANIAIHYASDLEGAEETARLVEEKGRKAWIFQADFAYPENSISLINRVFEETSIFGLIHNAAIFDPFKIQDITIDDWQRHLNINLTTPFFLSQVFAKKISSEGRIITMLDWRALRPGKDHLPYTISKAGLAALTKSLAVALAPEIVVNGIALGAILPPVDGGSPEKAVSSLPISRWADLSEVHETVQFLLAGPKYITGEIIYLDGGRHLV